MLPAGFEPALRGRRPRILDRTRLRERPALVHQAAAPLRPFRVTDSGASPGTMDSAERN